jgi:hypothetical protein
VANAGEPGQEGFDAFSLSRSSGCAELINRVLASGSTRLDCLSSLSPPAPSQEESADRALTGTRYIGHQVTSRQPQAEAEP